MIGPPPVCTAEVDFELHHPDDPGRLARLGHSPERGLYVQVEWAGVPVTLDEADVDPDRDPIVEIVALLTAEGFLQPRALDELRAWLTTPGCWRASRPPRRVRRTLRIVEALSDADAL